MKYILYVDTRKRKLTIICIASFLFYRGSLELISGKMRDSVKTCLQIFVGRNIIAHLTIVIFAVSHHIKVSGSGQTKDDRLFFPGFFTFQCLVDSNTDRVATFRSRKNTFHSCKLGCCFKYCCLFNASGFNDAIMIELG